ncbi:MAG: spore coat associated protein CotJA [Tissierellia bacterium]|nr:spore coat associated protein CotJA [Tissierellia bacterium]
MNSNYQTSNNCNKQLARCYVPIQVMNRVYSSREALRRGTLFPELYRPYTPAEKERRGNYYG